jgi:putative hemolysin
MPLLTLQELEHLSPLFRGRVGQALARGTMRLLSIDNLNALYDRHSHLRGVAFAHSVLCDLGIDYEVYAEVPETISQLNRLEHSSPLITISNHPCGHVDGLILVDYFGYIRDDYKLMANQVLARIEALSSTFIAVTPTGTERTAATRASVMGVRHALAHLQSGGALGLFPSGAVSDLSLRDGRVRDRQWQLPIVRLMAKACAPILPVRFLDGNSRLYYALGLTDWRIRLLRLPAEVFNKHLRPMRLVVGPIISPVEQQQYLATHTIEEYGLWLRSKVYGMKR